MTDGMTAKRIAKQEHLKVSDSERENIISEKLLQENFLKCF